MNVIVLKKKMSKRDEYDLFWGLGEGIQYWSDLSYFKKE